MRGETVKEQAGQTQEMTDSYTGIKSLPDLSQQTRSGDSTRTTVSITPDLGLCTLPQSLASNYKLTSLTQAPPHSQAKNSTSSLPSPTPTLPSPGDRRPHAPAFSGSDTSAPVL